jgi:hypothetical protein
MSFQLLILGLRQFGFWRQRQVVSTVALLIVVIIVACVDSVRGRWQALTQQHLDSAGFRLITVTARGTEGFTTDSAAQFRRDLPQCRVLPRLQNLVYVRTESGDWRPTLCGTFATDDPQLKGLPAAYGSLPTDDGSKTAVVSKKLLQRFGFNLGEGQTCTHLEISLELPEDGRRGLPFQIVMLVDDLEQPALRLPESTMIRWLNANAAAQGEKQDLRVSQSDDDPGDQFRESFPGSLNSGPEFDRAVESPVPFPRSAHWYDENPAEGRSQRLPEVLSAADRSASRSRDIATSSASLVEPSRYERNVRTPERDEPLEVAQMVIEVQDPRDVPKIASSLQSAGHRVESAYFQNSRQRALLEAIISVGGILVVVVLSLSVWAYSSQVVRSLQNEEPRLALMRMTGADSEAILSYVMAPALFNAATAIALGFLAANELFCGAAAKKMNEALEAEIFGGIEPGLVGSVVLITAVVCHLMPLIRIVARRDIDPDAHATL